MRVEVEGSEQDVVDASTLPVGTLVRHQASGEVGVIVKYVPKSAKFLVILSNPDSTYGAFSNLAGVLVTPLPEGTVVKLTV